MDFLREILSGKKKYFLQSEISHIIVPTFPELTVARVIKMVREHKSVMQYLPTVSEDGKQYIERDFLFDIVNTCDPKFFRDALAELEARRGAKAAEEQKSFVEIDSNIFNLLQQCQSRLTGSKMASSKRAMHALTSGAPMRQKPKRTPVQELEAQLRPAPKLSDEKYSQNVYDMFVQETTQILQAKRRFV